LHANPNQLDDSGSAAIGGLVLQLHPLTGLALLWRGRSLATAPPPGTGSWLPVRVSCNGTHANVWQAGIHAVRDMPVPLRAAAAAAAAAAATATAAAAAATAAAAAATAAASSAGTVWRFALGGRSDGAPNYVSRLRISSSGLLPTVTLPLRDAPNGQQFGATHGNFTYLVPPVLAAVMPLRLRLTRSPGLTLRPSRTLRPSLSSPLP
jgi:hypothetical protein